MNFVSRALLVAAFVCACAAALAQERPLERRFAAEESSRYLVEAVLRTEVDGQRPVRIGAQTYLEPFSRTAEARLAFVSARRIASVDAAGNADVEERLETFCVEPLGTPSDEEETQQMAAALLETLRAWAAPDGRTLRYRESTAGQLAGLGADGVPPLDESTPRLLTLWLLRALRPTATLPARPLRTGERWQEPRTVRLENWEDAHGFESGEWLDFRTGAETGGQPAVRLHVVQQIQGRVPLPESSGPGARAGEGNAGEKAPAADGKFYAESLSTLALADGRLLAAARSATREVARALDAGPAFREAPRFRGRMLVQVRIEECEDAACRPACRAVPGNGS